MSPYCGGCGQARERCSGCARETRFCVVCGRRLTAYVTSPGHFEHRCRDHPETSP